MTPALSAASAVAAPILDSPLTVELGKDGVNRYADSTYDYYTIHERRKSTGPERRENAVSYCNIHPRLDAGASHGRVLDTSAD